MKPRITVDESGTFLHVEINGKPVRIKLDPETIGAMFEALTAAKERLLTPEGKRAAVRALGRFFGELVSGGNGNAKE